MSMPERESTKHGPHLDDEMGHEVKGLVQGGRTTHAEEWKEPEPTDGMRVRRADLDPQAGIDPDDVERRSELARVLTRDAFPADRDELVGYLADKAASDRLVAEVRALPGGVRYATVGEVARALGLDVEDHRF